MYGFMLRYPVTFHPTHSSHNVTQCHSKAEMSGFRRKGILRRMDSKIIIHQSFYDTLVCKVLYFILLTITTFLVIHNFLLENRHCLECVLGILAKLSPSWAKLYLLFPHPPRKQPHRKKTSAEDSFIRKKWSTVLQLRSFSIKAAFHWGRPSLRTSSSIEVISLLGGWGAGQTDNKAKLSPTKLSWSWDWACQQNIR